MTAKTDDASGRSSARDTGRGPAPGATVQLSRADRVDRRKAARASALLESLGEFRPGRSLDPVGLLLGRAESRVQELAPVRHARMLVSPFTFYRVAAPPMAADPAGTPASRLRVHLGRTRTCPISGRSPRRNSALSSTSTTSTRPSPARLSGMSSGWPRASR